MHGHGTTPLQTEKWEMRLQDDFLYLCGLQGKTPWKNNSVLFKTDRFGDKTVKIEVENDHLRRKFDEKSGQKQGRISSKKRWQKCVGFDRFLKKSDNKIRKMSTCLLLSWRTTEISSEVALNSISPLA